MENSSCTAQGSKVSCGQYWPCSLGCVVSTLSRATEARVTTLGVTDTIQDLTLPGSPVGGVFVYFPSLQRRNRGRIVPTPLRSLGSATRRMERDVPARRQCGLDGLTKWASLVIFPRGPSVKQPGPWRLECGVASLGLGLTALATCDLERNRPVAGRKEGRWSKKRVSWAAALTHFPGLEVICLTLGHARLHMQHTAKRASPVSSQSVVCWGDAARNRQSTMITGRLVQTLFAGPGLSPMSSDPLCREGVTMVDSLSPISMGWTSGRVLCTLLQCQPAHTPSAQKIR